MRKWLIGGLVCLCVLTLAAAEVFAIAVDARGRIRVKYGVSNFPVGNNFGVVQTDLAGPTDESDSVWTVRQRMRNQFIFTLNEHLKGVWHQEIGYLEWGQNTPTEGAGFSRVGRGSGGGFGADGVNVETKELYMQFDVPFTDLRTKMGIFGVDHRIGNSAFFGTDMGAVRVEGPLFGPIDTRLTWVRHNATNFPTQTSHQSREANQWYFDIGLNVPDGTIPFANGVRAETGFYWFDDNTSRGSGYTTNTYITGLNLFGQIGPVKLANYFAYGWAISGAASQRPAAAPLAGFPGVPAGEPLRRRGAFNQFEATAPIGPGTFTLAFFFSSGDGDRSPGDRADRPTQDLNAFPGLQFMRGDTPGVNFDGTDNICFGGNASLELICGDIIDEWILVASPNNDDLGIILPIFGYSIKPTKNTQIGLKIAPLWSAVGNPNSKDDSSYMGVEILVPVTIRIWDGLAIDIRGGYFARGGFWEMDPTIPGTNQAARAAREDPDDTWLFVTRFQYNW